MFWWHPNGIALDIYGLLLMSRTLRDCVWAGREGRGGRLKIYEAPHRLIMWLLYRQALVTASDTAIGTRSRIIASSENILFEDTYRIEVIVCSSEKINYQNKRHG